MSALLQTRVPAKLARALEQHASAQGLSMAAWLRQMLTAYAEESAPGLRERLSLLEQRVQRLERAR